MATTNEDPAAGAGVQGLEEVKHDCSPDSTDSDGQAFADVRGELALLGHQLHRSDHADGTPIFFVSRWGLVKHFDSFNEVRAFIKQIGGRP